MSNEIIKLLRDEEMLDQLSVTVADGDMLEVATPASEDVTEMTELISILSDEGYQLRYTVWDSKKFQFVKEK